MSGKAAKIVITEKQQAILKRIVNASTSSVRHQQRASIVLLAFEGLLNEEIAERVNLSPQQVGLWRRRWQLSFEALVAIECRETHAELSRMIEQVLTDAPRLGSPGKFTAEQITLILAVACESPELSDRPVTHWTHRELADEVVKRGMVESISTSHVGELLRAAELQPHRSKYWLNTKEKCAETFRKQANAVCQTYLKAPELQAQNGTHTVSVDEMPGVQALERAAKTIPMQPGQPERIEYEYIRHGTVCLIGNWDVVEGQMIAPTITQTRTELDLVQHIHQTIELDPLAPWVFVWDNLNVHCSEALVSYVAKLEGIGEATLGVKGESGILKSMATRREFLSRMEHRVRFVFTPKHCSWLNQIEIVFGIVQRRAIRRGNFTSLENLKERLLRFIDYFNRTFAQPFRWTYTGRPVKTQATPRPRTWRETWNEKCETRQALAVAL